MQDLLTELLTVTANPKVTMQIPASLDQKRRSLMIRHQLEEVEARLASWDIDAASADALIGRARARAEDPSLAVARSGTAAVYVAMGFEESALWPAPLAERVAIGSEFYLRDTVSLLDTAECYLLTLSRGGAALYRADGLAIEQLDVPDIPADLAEATQHFDPERQLQFHQAQSGRSGGAAVYHGHGIGEGRDIEELRIYLRAVDKGVHEVVAAAEAPLVLVGSDELPSEYSAVTRLDVVEEIRKNPESIGSAELHGFAVTALGELRSREVGAVHERVEGMVGSGRASHDPNDVLAAAVAGKVEFLLIDPDTPGDVDLELVNRAVVATLRNRGRVYPDPELPAGVAVAASFRY